MEEPGIPDGIDRDIYEFGGLSGLRGLKPDSSVIRRLEKLYSLLSAGGRIEILYFLNFSSMTPGMLSFLTGMAPNLLSFHLRKLEKAGIVATEREGKFVIYRITDVGRTLSGPLSGD